MISLKEAALSYGERVLWRDLTLDVEPGEFLVVLGPNGSGKTSLLRALLGEVPLSAGTMTIGGRPPRRGSPLIGYVPQQKAMSPAMPLRSRDLVRLGIDGHRWGMGRAGRAVRARVDELLAEVGAESYADVPIGTLSGGEQQRLRIAQALATDPRILLCDEPLLSLDPHHQQAVAELIDRRRRRHDTAVVFVTHEINPVLPMVDRVLYFVDGRFRAGTVREVMTSHTLSDLYGTPVEVIRAGGRILMAGALDAAGHHHPGGEEHGP
ncbi:ABC transporter ATP-binding protein [Sphaerisporangium album]|uniref:ABC transporter ATP-binding protein n=1 Tax=Sphaerisporangium album TaxID=509200 RepID=A0A367FHV9_9ACTN|nr:ABC transporter ATP-binding protein [Sphaerisporangium album]RCG29911.1 ABC transporter ATP-binding protein [Sphaerisporangium album]